MWLAASKAAETITEKGMTITVKETITEITAAITGTVAVIISRGIITGKTVTREARVKIRRDQIPAATLATEIMSRLILKIRKDKTALAATAITSQAGKIAIK